MQFIRKLIKKAKKKWRKAVGRSSGVGAEADGYEAPEFFGRTKEAKIDQFLAGLGRNAHIIARQELLNHLRHLSPRASFSSSPGYDGSVNNRENVFILMPDELKIARNVREDHPRSRVFSVKYDLLPAILTGSPDRIFRQSDSPADPELKFAVFCTPRSGSTYLCSLLTKAGCGEPVEHVRDPMVYLLRQGLDFPQVLERLYRGGTKNRVFGTKVIHHYLFNGFNNEEARASLRSLLADEGFRIIYLERDKIEQAVSQYFANSTRIWHVRRDFDDKLTERYAQIPYDFEKLKTRYEWSLRGEAELQSFLEGFDQPVLHLDYASLDSEPGRVLEEVLEFLGVGQAFPVDDRSQLTKKVSGEMPMVQDYVARLRQDLGLVG